MTTRPDEWLVNVVVPLVTVSESNARGHWSGRARRVKAQREAVAQRLRRCPLPSTRALAVHLTRVSPRQLDDDNLRGALKACRDAVAMWLGVGDGPTGPIAWTYGQQKAPARHGSFRGVGIQIGALAHGPDRSGREDGAGPRPDGLAGEPSGNVAKAEPRGAKLTGATNGHLFAGIEHQATSPVDRVPERNAARALAACLLCCKRDASARAYEAAFVRGEGIDDAREQPALRRVRGADPIGGNDLGAEGTHQALDGRSNYNVTRQSAALGHDQDASAERLDIGQRRHEPRPCVRLACPADVVDVKGHDVDALTCGPTDDVGALCLNAKYLVRSARPERRHPDLGIAGLRNAFRHASETYSRRRYSKNCSATNGGQQNSSSRVT